MAINLTTSGHKQNSRPKVRPKTKEKESNEWTSSGQVLGGDIPSEASTSMSAEERRRLLAEKTEQRLAQMTSRGAKGVVRLSTRAKADIDVPLNDSNSKLQWKI